MPLIISALYILAHIQIFKTEQLLLTSIFNFYPELLINDENSIILVTSTS